MHMHSHPVLYVCYFQAADRQAALLGFSCLFSFSVGSPGLLLLLLRPHFAWINWVLIFCEKAHMRTVWGEREKSDRKNARDRERDQWQKPRGHSAPRGWHSPVSWGTMRPFCCDSYLYPLNSHPSTLQERPMVVRVRQKCFFTPQPKGGCYLI